MRARRYTDVIDIYQKDKIDDGYGGTTPTDVFKFSKWAKVETQGSGNKFKEFGLNDFKNPVIFRVRKGNNEIEESMFIRFQEKDFIVKGIENVNLENREINIFCDET